MIGQTISHYKITEKLGEGGMGEVYLAEDTSLKRKVALKFLPDYLQQDEVAQKRFLREAQSAAALDHPYICKIYETGDADGKSFIAMEYVKGQTLKEKLLEGPVRLKETLQIGMEIAEALEEAHKAGIAHRDLKPANIMLTSGGHVKVMDFGLAKKVVDEDGTEQDITSALTREGTTLGTIAYMSPEQLRGKTVDTRSDIFSFGIVLYELLSGVHPFRKPKQVETTNAILSEDPSPLSRYTEDTADLLQHTVEKMLEKSPDDRYQSVHEVRSNLRKLSEKLSAPEVAPALARTTRGIWLGAGALVVVLVGIALSLYYYWQGPAQVTEVPIESIAVLPFSSADTDPESESLANGIPASISASLLQLKRLKVKVLPPAVLMRYKRKETEPKTVAEEQDVSAVLMGVVERRGDNLAVTVNLIDGRDNTLIWGQTYSREISDIFVVQENITRQVAEGLRFELIPEESNLLAQHGTMNPEAYQALVLGRYYWLRPTAAGSFVQAVREAIQCWEQAVALDQNYQEAYWELARNGYFELARRSGAKEEFAKARANWEKLVEIDDSTVLAHQSRAAILWRYERRWAEAEAEYIQASELDSTFERDGEFLEWMGRQDERVAQLERQLQEVDPFSWFYQCSLGWRFLFNRQYDHAIELAKKAIALEPQTSDPYGILQQSYRLKGMDREAFEAFLEARKTYNATEEQLGEYREVFQKSGWSGVLRLHESQDQPYQRPIYSATRYGVLGKKDRAFEWLEKAWAMPLWGMEDAPSYPMLDPLRSDPRFEELLRKLNLPEEAIQRHLALPGGNR